MSRSVQVGSLYGALKIEARIDAQVYSHMQGSVDYVLDLEPNWCNSVTSDPGILQICRLRITPEMPEDVFLTCRGLSADMCGFSCCRRTDNLQARVTAKAEKKKAKREKKLLRPGFEGRRSGFIPSPGGGGAGGRGGK